MRKIISALTVLMAFVTSISVAEVFNVNCNAGDSITDAIAGASAGDEIIVVGTCNEAVTITIDNLSIDGQGLTVVDADSTLPPKPVILIDGARGVEIKGLEVRNGLFGVSLQKGAHVSLIDVVSSQSQVMGINAIEKSLVSVHDVTIVDAEVHGVNIMEASNLKVTGSLSVSNSAVFSINMQDGSVLTADNASILLNNNLFGLHISVGSSAFVNESTIEANENALIGVAVDNGSKLFMFSSQMQANNNGLDGIDCNINSNVDFDAASSLSANDNGRNGISLEDTTFNVFSIFIVPGPSIEALNNAQNGVILTLGSKFDIGINSTFTATGNGTNGMLIDDGSTAILTDATVTGHGEESSRVDRDVGDLRVTFGSRATAVGDTMVGRTLCDKSTLLRGGLVCEKPFLDEEQDDDD